MKLVRRLAYMWSFNLLALYAAASLISGISYSDSFGTLALTALVFAAVNLFLKPATKLLAFPLILVTLGVALFFINVLMLYVTDWIVSGFSIAHFGAAVWATIVIWGVNWVLQIVFDVDDRHGGRARRSRREKRTAES
jgi:putative membrane protein